MFVVKKQLSEPEGIIAERFKPFLPSWINNDQLGFVTGREGKDNYLKSLFLIHEEWG